MLRTMPTNRLSLLRSQVLPYLSAFAQEVIQPGLATADRTVQQIAGDLACPTKEAWLRGAHRHMSLHGALQRFAAMQAGWTRSVINNVPIYQIADGVFLTIKRTPQGRSAARPSSSFLDIVPFELGYEQQSFLPEVQSLPIISNLIALDYVAREDGHHLTALLLRRGRKRFDPLCCLVSTPVLRLIPKPLDIAPAAGPKPATIRSKIRRAQNDNPG